MRIPVADQDPARGHSMVNSRVDEWVHRAADFVHAKPRPRSLVANLIPGGMIATILVAIATTLAGCGVGAPTGGARSSPTDAPPSYSLAIADARGQVARALAPDG